MSQWIFNMSVCGSKAGMETSTSLVNDIDNNALFHSSPHFKLMTDKLQPVIVNVLFKSISER